ncbi:MAG: hypothetical protein MI864_24740 [Pseudomonadales bacterium]|nr:hypothetical protein [Pseudomonadales bacterium]
MLDMTAHSSRKTKRPGTLITATLITETLRPTALVLAITALFSQSLSANPQDTPQYAIGGSIGTSGLGISVSGKTPWSFVQDDQVQWRGALAGMSIDDIDDLEINNTEYKDADFASYNLQTGLDWYPFQGWAEEIFFSSGLLLNKTDISGFADMDKTFKVGNKEVRKGDITSLELDIEDKGVMPYISVGWGNKLANERGFDFHAELGLAAAFQSPDVKLTAVDPDNFLSAADLAREKDDIEDDLQGLRGFINATVSYHF